MLWILLSLFAWLIAAAVLLVLAGKISDWFSQPGKPPKFKPSLELLEDRCCPVVHSFSAATTHTDNPAAGGTAANQVVAAVVGTPAPVAASAGHAGGVPFQSSPPSVPGR